MGSVDYQAGQSLLLSLSRSLVVAATYVTPGLITGWLSCKNGFVSGGLAGGIGALIGNSIVFMLWSEGVVGSIPSQAFIGMAWVAIIIAVTNGIGGVAGESIRKKYLSASS